MPWTQPKQIINEKGEVIINTTKIQRIIRDYREQLHINKMNLEETDKFLEIQSFPRLNHEERENMNKLITSNKIESVTKKLPTIKSPGPDIFIGESYKIFKEQLNLILNYSKKLKKEHLQTHSHKRYYPSTKLDKNIIKKRKKERKLQSNNTNEYRNKNPQQNISKLNHYIKRIRQVFPLWLSGLKIQLVSMRMWV